MKNLHAITCAGLLLSVAGAHAQEAMYTAAATMPSKGTLLLREQYHYYAQGADRYGGTDRTIRHQLMTSLALGLERGLALYVDVPVETRVSSRSAARGFGRTTETLVPEVNATLKWRFYQDDSGGVDTTRIALLGGVRLDTDTQLSLNPHIGIVYTRVWGRHGFNQELHYTLNTSSDRTANFGGDGSADALASNTAYLYRIYPERYTSESTGAWYATIELNSLYETSGDFEMRLSPGLMFEGREFGFEIMAQLPVYQRVRHRSELDFAIGIGIRFLF
jgi:hypothetical protein